MPGHPLELSSDFQKFLTLLTVLGHRLQFGRLIDRLVDRHLELGRHELRDLVHVAEGHVHHPADIPDYGLRPHRPERHDLANIVATVFVDHIVDHTLSIFVGDVVINIGWRDTFRVQESLEHQTILDRINRRDPERIPDQAAHRGSATTGPNPLLFAELNQIVQDKEIAGIAGLLNDVELELQPLLILWCDIPDPTFQRLAGPMLEEGERIVEPAGQWEVRGVRLVERHLEVAFLRDLECPFAGIRKVMKQFIHLVRRPEVDPRRIAHPVRIIKGLTRLDRHQGGVSFVIVLLEEMRVVGRDERNAHLLVQLDQPFVDLRLFVDAVTLDLQVEIVPEDVEILLDSLHSFRDTFPLDQVRNLTADARRQADQSLAVLTEQFFVDPRSVIESFQVAR